MPTVLAGFHDRSVLASMILFGAARVIAFGVGVFAGAAWQSVAAFLILAPIAHVSELRLWFGASATGPAATQGV